MALKRTWLRVRGLTGDFTTPEDSARARELTAAWEQAWPGSEPVGYLLRGADKWVRFHSLPGGKRYADSPQEYEEILRRHHAVLEALSGGLASEQLLAIGEDYGPRDLSTGWTRRHLHGAWPWRRWYDENGTESWSYFWVKSGLTRVELGHLLTATANGETSVIIVGPGLRWIYAPYDGGADVVAPDRVERDALHDRFAEWLSERADGL
ncbi:DUF3885 domain-containing protein [Kribbella sp. NPDC054772]